MPTHDNGAYDQLVVENRILGLQLRRVAERCERLEQELLWERVEGLRRIREIVRAQERERGAAMTASDWDILDARRAWDMGALDSGVNHSPDMVEGVVGRYSDAELEDAARAAYRADDGYSGEDVEGFMEWVADIRQGRLA